MATVIIQRRENKSGVSYAVQYRDPISGYKRHYKTFRKKKEAEHARNELRILLDTGEKPKEKVRFRPLTFSEVARELEKDLSYRNLVGEISDKTHYEYKIRVKLLERTFGQRMLHQVAEEDLKAFLMREAVEHSNITANHHLKVFRQLMRKGIELKALDQDPTKNLRRFSEKNHERNRFLLPHEIDMLIEAASQGRAKYYLPPLVCLGVEHGASKQECLSLKWSDIDFDFNSKGLIRFKRTKNNRERTEFLMPRSRAALLAWRDHLQYKRFKAGFEGTTEHVFCRINGTPLKRFDKAFREACSRAGIIDLHFHDLRHTFCSNLILSGANLKDAKEMIGHADIGMTDRYSHLTAQHKSVIQERLHEYYENQWSR